MKTLHPTILILTAACLGAAPVPLRQTPPTPVLSVAMPTANAAADTDFLLRLGLMEGHLMVGNDLIAAHQAPLALPHFGHPVSELYDDIANYLAARKFPAFDRQLVKLEAAVATAPYAPETLAQYQAVIATIHHARDLTPADLRASVPAMIKICADTLDAAAGEYSGAVERGRIQSLIEYHDSRGFVGWATQYLHVLTLGHPDDAAQTLLNRMTKIAAQAAWIVQPLLPDPTPRASVAQYRAIAAQAVELAKK
jgi:hypothetical protein